MIGTLWGDIRYAVRSLGKAPGYALTVILTLALGIGAASAIFSVVNGVLLRPLAYRDADRLVTSRAVLSPGDFADWRRTSRTLDLGAAEYWTPTLQRGNGAEEIRALHISPEILPMTGVAPILGRVFAQAEEHAGSDRVVLLSYDAWASRFGRDPNIVGRAIQLNGTAYTVVGVMPRGFRFAPYWATEAQLWAPLDLDARLTDHGGGSLRVFGRLAPGVTPAQAAREADAIALRMDRAHGGTRRAWGLMPLKERVVESVRQPVLDLFAAACLLLLIACVNVTHLQLTRASARRRTQAIRGALGASRWQLVRLALTESGALALAGGLGGLLLARAGLAALRAAAPSDLPRLDAIAIDGRVVAFVAGVAALAGMLAGLVPAVVAHRAAGSDAFRDGGRGTTRGPAGRRARGALVASELAMAMMLLVSAGLVTRSFLAMLAVRPGFDPSSLLTMTVSLRGTAHEDPAARATFYGDLLERLRALPGVQAAGAVNHLPLNGDTWKFHFAVEGQPPQRPEDAPQGIFRVVRPGYFDAMRMAITRGRDISPQDLSAGAHVLVVNASLAHRFWPGEDPIGKRLTMGDPSDGADWFTVVGIAADAKQTEWTDPTAPEMFFPNLAPAPGDSASHASLSLLDPSYLTFVVRTAREPDALVGPVRSTVAAMDRGAAVSNVITMQGVVRQELAQPRFYLLLLGAFALVAIVLAAVGVFGVVSYAVERRRREIGVRVALGADGGRVARLVLGETLIIAGIGAAAGLVGAVAAGSLLRSLLFEVRPVDPATLGAAAGTLLLIALAASALPARRAAATNPVDVLREE